MGKLHRKCFCHQKHMPPWSNRLAPVPFWLPHRLWLPFRALQCSEGNVNLAIEFMSYVGKALLWVVSSPLTGAISCFVRNRMIVGTRSQQRLVSRVSDCSKVGFCSWSCCGTIRSLESSSFCCFRVLLAREKKMTLRCNSSIIVFFRL